MRIRVLAIFLLISVAGLLPAANSDPVAAPSATVQEHLKAFTQALLAHDYDRAEARWQQALDSEARTAGGALVALAALVEFMPLPDESLSPEVLRALGQWVEDRPRSAIALTLRAVARGLAPDTLHQGERELLLALAQEPQSLLTLATLLRFGIELEYDRARWDDLFERAITAPPYAPSLQLLRLTFLARKGASSEELLRYARRMAKTADSGTALVALIPRAHELVASRSDGEEYFLQHEVWKEVRSSWERLLLLFPSSAVYPAFFATQARLAGDNDLAEKLYARAIAQSEQNWWIYKAGADFQADELQNYGEAVNLYSKAIRLRPRLGSLYVSRGRSYQPLRNLAEAEADYRMAIKLAPQVSVSYHHLGHLLRQLPGRTEEALAALDEAIRLAPADSKLHLDRCLVLEQLRQNEAALRACSTAIGLEAPSEPALLARSRIYKALGRQKEALVDFHAAARLRDAAGKTPSESAQPPHSATDAR
ncbi:MAG: hypothetical protein KDD69_07620 [Bdellovibrionales bacterium]|nr:hypothetical protein [Bdellovibrionales bacterium]